MNILTNSLLIHKIYDKGEMGMPASHSFDKLKKNISQGTDSFFRTSKNFLHVSEINLSISSCENEKYDIYASIGEKIYKEYKKRGYVSSFLKKYCIQIDEIDKKIASLEKQVLEVKGIRICPHCEKEIDDNSTFCSHCGAKV